MDRVVTIIDQARTNVLRAVNSNMVIAYWLIGREIVQALQGGEERADYGSRLLAELSESLKRRYGRGFSATNLKYFRLFFQAYANRSPEIRHEPRDELSDLDQASVLADISAGLAARARVLPHHRDPRRTPPLDHGQPAHLHHRAGARSAHWGACAIW
ncbi:MAG: DUF1016 family protein [Hydrogenophaga sp.]|nr:DUF1016 family protein [Hydrogenophaga sp.]